MAKRDWWENDFTMKKKMRPEDKVLAAAKKAGVDSVSLRYSFSDVRAAMSSNSFFITDVRKLKCRVGRRPGIWSCTGEALAVFPDAGREQWVPYRLTSTRKGRQIKMGKEK